MKAKRLMTLSIIFLLIMQLTGCNQEKSTANKIAPVNKDKITVMSVSYGNRVTKEFTDTEQIDTGVL